MGIGLIARQRYRPSMRCNSNDPRQCSVFTIGRTMLTEMQVQAAQAVAAVIQAKAEVSEKWG